MIRLELVTRENWLTALDLAVFENQQSFIPTVAVSLAKIAIKPDSVHATYIPFAIMNGEEMVGFIMHTFEEHTNDMYWINGFLIDKRFQGKGYGKAAIQQLIDYITKRFPQCKEIRLTVSPKNTIAKHLYENIGFQLCNEKHGEELIMRRPIV